MGKIIQEEYITGEKGVAEFNSFCTNHEPFLIFREEAKHDFGIDGEIEVTRRTDFGKIEATGKVIKVQLKSTKKESYIANNNKESFEFIAKTNDIEYWNKHELPVVIVVFFEQKEELFIKKIDKLQILNKKKKSHRIKFDKEKNRLIKGKSNIEEVIGQEFVPRIDYYNGERLFSNLMRVNLPEFVYEYESKYKQIKKIFNIINETKTSFPHFILISNKLVTFSELKDIPDSILNRIIKSSSRKKTKRTKYSITKDNRRNISWLVNLFFKDFFYYQKIIYNRDFNRYYFSKLNESPIEVKVKENSRAEVYRKVQYKGRSNMTSRSLVTKYTYYEESFFFKHLGFQIHFDWIENDLYVSLEPKYYYSIDGFSPLENPKRITRLTNQLKSTERNQQYLNHLFFYRNFFGKGRWIIKNHNSKIEISKKIFFDVDFKIAGMKVGKLESITNVEQQQLKFDL